MFSSHATCLPRVAYPCDWIPYSYDSQPSEYELSDALNKAGYLVKLLSASFLGSTLSGSFTPPIRVVIREREAERSRIQTQVRVAT